MRDETIGEARQRELNNEADRMAQRFAAVLNGLARHLGPRMPRDLDTIALGLLQVAAIEEVAKQIDALGVLGE